jgi:hypothetical protein
VTDIVTDIRRPTMSAECTVNAIGIAKGDCEISVAEQLKRSLLPIAVFALALIAGAVIMSSLPLTGTPSDVVAVPEVVSSASPLAGPEYRVARSRIDAAIGSNSPLAGPEFWAARSRFGTAGAVAEASSIDSPLAGPEFYVARSRSGAAVSSDSPLAGPEYFVSR